MGALLIMFAISIAVATFIENDYGILAARSKIYNSKWFEILLVVIAVNMTGRLILTRLYKKKKFTLFLFHLSFLLIILGAGLTRYFGSTGTMHIREDSVTNTMTSEETYLKIVLEDGPTIKIFEKNTMFSKGLRNALRKKIDLEDKRVLVELTGYIPNASESIIPDRNGEPIISLIVSNMNNHQHIFLKKGEHKLQGDLYFGFNEPAGTGAIFINHRDSGLIIRFPENVQVSSMTGDEVKEYKKGIFYPFKKGEIYSFRDNRIVLAEFYEKAITKWIRVPEDSYQTYIDVLEFSITGNKRTEKVILVNQLNQRMAEKDIETDGLKVRLMYGKKLIDLPFSLHLKDFQLERYPGSMSPSSFVSEVVVIDERSEVEMPFRIFMNNVLKYKGYRFYQSSYDQDEMGTILFVNHDFFGTFFTYAGYFLVTLSIVLSVLNKNSRFRGLAINSTTRPKNPALIITIILFCSGLFFPGFTGKAQTFNNTEENVHIITNSLVKDFGRLLVQDKDGRIKPVNTLASDIIRKISRKVKFEGLCSTQVFLSMLANPHYWQDVPIIKVANSELSGILGIKGNYAAFNDFIDFNKGRTYKIRNFVEQAYSKKPLTRNKFDKEVINVDERVNICYLIYSGSILRIFPKLGDKNLTWFSPVDAYQFVTKDDSLFVKDVFQLYLGSINEARITGNWIKSREYLESIKKYQQIKGKPLIPSKSKISLEILYYNLDIFKRLFLFYGLVGLFFLFLLIGRILTPKLNNKIVITGIKYLLLAGFFAHTLGLGVRWYISGHAPWSNGYESMIYIAWITILAGFIFVKRSTLALSATAILSSLVLLIAHTSWMNPEITNLVPVLKSHWLILHVSIVTASYGFLGLGAILGLLNLILYVLKTEENKVSLQEQIVSITRIVEMTLILGLYLLIIGTILGAVWANESWGRYWGWDPKETWSLVTILIYAFIIHMRQIPGFKSRLTLNFFALTGYGSVLMTYFGVNYYLTGLHSYAQGDPVPVPYFVYYSVLMVIMLATLAYFKDRKYRVAES
jgi:cytochrome c-type biogenesis protein CcsB